MCKRQVYWISSYQVAFMTIRTVLLKGILGIHFLKMKIIHATWSYTLIDDITDLIIHINWWHHYLTTDLIIHVYWWHHYLIIHVNWWHHYLIMHVNWWHHRPDHTRLLMTSQTWSYTLIDDITDLIIHVNWWHHRPDHTHLLMTSLPDHTR